ncbi:hypothetical protein HPB50_017353 [Hyalomma asiaticum]|uniref:Uncharacterized protein n=1 Tax=Hyalomma asiaticum TaxID=266040 RepID=A0ACB7S9G0_HYAAI|nr:hypothetical protein HPB50_017353 [Hyalomma asiaticum]
MATARKVARLEFLEALSSSSSDEDSEDELFLSLVTGRTDEIPKVRNFVGETVKLYSDVDVTPGSSSASKIDDPKGSNALNQEKGGVRTQTGVSAAGKRPLPKSSTDSESASVTGVEEPPAKAPHGRRSSLRPRPNISADKRAGKTESLDEGQSLAPDGSGGAGGV